MNDSVITLLPPLLAIIVAILRKSAIQALIVGFLASTLMQYQFDVFDTLTASAEGVVNVVTSGGNFRIIVFSLLIGALLSLIKQSGGVNGFIYQLNQKKLVNSERKAALLPAVIGSVIFTDTNLSMFSAGIASQSVFDKYRLSRARLAFIIDSTCSPVSILLLINGWGAYILGLLDGYRLDDKVGVLIDTVMYNFYPILVLVVVYFTAVSGRVFGPLKHAHNHPEESQMIKEVTKQGKARYMLLPMVSIIIVTLVLLYITGDGDLRRGSGSFSVMWSVITSCLLLASMLLIDKVFTVKEILKHGKGGVVKLMPAVVVLVLSFAFGDAVKALGTGTYVSGLMSVELTQIALAPMLFLTAGVMAFATGTSWGTFAILFPIAIPLALQSGFPPAFLIAAVLGGGVFGDHASPISDSTIVASIASGCEHIEHVKTQLPYTIVIALISMGAYIGVGLFLI